MIRWKVTRPVADLLNQTNPVTKGTETRIDDDAKQIYAISSDILRLAQELPNGIIRNAEVEAAITLSDAGVPLEDICSLEPEAD